MGVQLLSGIRSSFSPDRYPVDYYPVLSGKTVSGTSLLTKQRDNSSCSAAFVQSEVHDKFCQNIRSERRQKNEDGIWIHVSLFCLGLIV